MSDLPVFERALRIYWHAGYQIQIHVNGDAGLDRVLNTLEKNQRQRPRFDHPTTIVHFAVSQPDQVARIRRLGWLVSGNPYYVTSLADNYGKVGLGPSGPTRWSGWGMWNGPGSRFRTTPTCRWPRPTHCS